MATNWWDVANMIFFFKDANINEEIQSSFYKYNAADFCPGLQTRAIQVVKCRFMLNYFFFLWMLYPPPWLNIYQSYGNNLWPTLDTQINIEIIKA